MGDPRGIGSDIILKSLKVVSLEEKGVLPVIVGDEKILKLKAKEHGIKITRYSDGIDVPGIKSFISLKSSGSAGLDALNYINRALALCRQDYSSVMVTGPVSKESIAKEHAGFMGHTEYLAKMTGKADFAMVFISASIKMSLITTHIPLKKVSDEITSSKISKHVELLKIEFEKWFGLKDIRFILCSLNPHSGEQGLFGNEENGKMRPAVKSLKEKGVKIEGPVGAYEALKKTLDGMYDFIVTPYHDQILTAAKIFLGPLVNVTMGLPFIRTSPDHGPAIDYQDKNNADFRSMKAAIELAGNLKING